MLSGLFFVGTRIDPIKINTRKRRSSIDILDTKSLLSCTIEQKQRIIDFLFVSRQMFEWGRRFWSASSMSAAVSVCGCRWNSCCLAHRQAIVIMHLVWSWFFYLCEALCSAIVVLIYIGRLSNMRFCLLIRRIRWQALKNKFYLLHFTYRFAFVLTALLACTFYQIMRFHQTSQCLFLFECSSL